MNTLAAVRRSVASSAASRAITTCNRKYMSKNIVRSASIHQSHQVVSRNASRISRRTFVSNNQYQQTRLARQQHRHHHHHHQYKQKHQWNKDVAPIAAYATALALTIAACTTDDILTYGQGHDSANRDPYLMDQSQHNVISKVKQRQGWNAWKTPSTCQCEAVATSDSSTVLDVQDNQTNIAPTQPSDPSPASDSNTDLDSKSDSNQPRNVMVHRLRSIRARSLADKYLVDWKTVLGEGAYGSVHPARLCTTGEKVALKKISKRYTSTSSFCRETDALLRIYNNGGHPNISGLRDIYEDHDHYYLVMDLVSGGEMFDHLIQYGAYSEADAARLMREVASALAFLHGVGVVHADLKPENLLLCSKKRLDGTTKMIDFGCAIVENDQYDSHDLGDDDNGEVNKREPEGDCIVAKSQPSELGVNGVQRTLQNWIETLNKKVHDESISEKSPESTGTTAYWPPERFNKESPAKSADMWAVGVILFIMLTGVHPFDLTGVATDAEIAEQIRKDPSPPMTPRLTSHLSPAAIDLIKMLMDKNSADRLTADEMLQHPWIAGDEANTDVITGSAEKLGKFRDLKAIIEAGIFSILIEKGSKEMNMSEYTPKMVYKDDHRGGTDKHAPASSVLKGAFEVFDHDKKGFVSGDDLSRVVTETTGQELSDSEKKQMIHPFNEDTAGFHGLSLSSFSKVAAGLKHKHFPRGHIVFRAGDIGDAMYFINSGKVEIQTKKGQLIHILRHGDFFGEGSLLEVDNRRFSTAKCATPVDFIKIKRSEFEK